MTTGINSLPVRPITTSEVQAAVTSHLGSKNTISENRLRITPLEADEFTRNWNSAKTLAQGMIECRESGESIQYAYESFRTMRDATDKQKERHAVMREHGGHVKSSLSPNHKRLKGSIQQEGIEITVNSAVIPNYRNGEDESDIVSEYKFKLVTLYNGFLAKLGGIKASDK